MVRCLEHGRRSDNISSHMPLTVARHDRDNEWKYFIEPDAIISGNMKLKKYFEQRPSELFCDLNVSLTCHSRCKTCYLPWDQRFSSRQNTFLLGNKYTKNIYFHLTLYHLVVEIFEQTSGFEDHLVYMHQSFTLKSQTKI